MTVDVTVVRRRLERMLGEARVLRRFQAISYESFRNDDMATRTVERSLQVIAQAAIDIAGHIISQQRWGVPGEYREAVLTLQKQSVISDPLASELVHLVGMRNILVHGYLEVDLGLVHASIGPAIACVESFVRAIEKYLRESVETE
ncbi:MAG: DUF86 domain-containing protein [Candidatus Thorarchaeota archaeon]|nr:DUF86 domain-containing protein [Candidatus Thorarchaeota archaeon]